MSMTNYIIVMKALEDGKFLITFPDFEGLTATADSEESIQSVATETIKTKLAELKKDNLVIPEAKKMKDVSSTLNEGEFTTYIPVKEEFDFKAAMNTTMASLKDKESVKETATSLAKGVEGVSDVYNELRVGNKINFGQITKDSWITTQIKSKLFVGDNVKATDVKVITENGEAFLLGNLTRSQADSAAEIASKVTGVQKVIKVFKYLN